MFGFYRGLADFAELDDEQERKHYFCQCSESLPEILSLIIWLCHC